MIALYLIGCTSLVGGLIGFNWWSTRRSEKAARAWIASFHGERLPPPETLRDKGYSTTWLLTVMPFYLEQAREDERKKRPARQLGTPIDPDNEPDCPECANGVSHEQCRTGWRTTLRENVREYAKAKYGAMPEWKSPCDTCGGNCGQCASSHCGICGVKPRDGKCDLVMHEAFRLKQEREKPPHFSREKYVVDGRPYGTKAEAKKALPPRGGTVEFFSTDELMNMMHPPPPRNECRICGDNGLYPGLNAYGGGICPSCGKKASKRC